MVAQMAPLSCLVPMAISSGLCLFPPTSLNLKDKNFFQDSTIKLELACKLKLPSHAWTMWYLKSLKTVKDCLLRFLSPTCQQTHSGHFFSKVSLTDRDTRRPVITPNKMSSDSSGPSHTPGTFNFILFYSNNFKNVFLQLGFPQVDYCNPSILYNKMILSSCQCLLFFLIGFGPSILVHFAYSLQLQDGKG